MASTVSVERIHRVSLVNSYIALVFRLYWAKVFWQATFRESEEARLSFGPNQNLHNRHHNHLHNHIRRE